MSLAHNLLTINQTAKASSKQEQPNNDPAQSQKDKCFHIYAEIWSWSSKVDKVDAVEIWN